MTMSGKAPSLKRLRSRERLTQEQVAEKAGVGVRTIQRLENGGVARHDTLERLAEVLSVSVDDLCEPPPAESQHEPESPGRRWEVIPVHCVERGSDLVDLVAGHHAMHFSRIDVDLDEDRDLVAELEQELQEELDVLSELGPVARRECERMLDERIAQLRQRGLRVVGGSKSYQLSLPAVAVPISPPGHDMRWYVAYVAVGREGRLPTQLVRDRSEPLT